MRFALKGLWLHADFMKLWTGETISLLGSQITLLALPLTAESILKVDAQQMGILGAAQFLPFILFGLMVGVMIDRRRRRPILIAANLGRAILLATIPLAAITHVLGIELLYVVSFLVGTLTLFFDVAYQAYLPSLVSREALVEGNSKLEVSRAIAQISGPGIAGILVKILTAPITMALDAVSFLFSALFLWRVRTPEQTPEPRTADSHIRREIVEGLGVVFGSPLLRSIAACTASSNLFYSIQLAVIILFLRRELHLDEGVIGLVYAIGSIGGLVGAVSVHRITRAVGVGPAIIGSSLMFGFAALIIPLAWNAEVASVLLLIVSQLIFGVANVTYNVNQVSLRQSITPDRLQGRMNASMRFIVWGTIPIGSLIGGYLGDHIGLRSTLWVAAIGALLPFLWVLFSPVRHIRVQPTLDNVHGETATT